jgi:hypothetical protein
MQDGNHLIARIADSHMPTSIMESEVRRVLPSLCGPSLMNSILTDCDDEICS